MVETRSQASRTAQASITATMTDPMENRVQALEEALRGLANLPSAVQALHDRMDARDQQAENHHDQDQHHHERRGYQQPRDEYTPPTRLTKLDFPKFQRQDILGWIYNCERYFDLDGTPENCKVRRASMNLDEKGYIWHLAYTEEAGSRISWQKYKSAMMVRFGPLNNVNLPRTSTWNNGGSIPRPANGTKGNQQPTETLLQVTADSPSITSGVIGSWSFKTANLQGKPSLNLLCSTQNESITVDTMEDATEKNKEMKMNFDRTLGSSLGASSLSLQVERESCDSAKATTSVCDSAKRMTSVSSHLPLSPTVSVISKTIVSDCSMSLSIDYVLGLGKIHQSMWQDQKFAWLKEVLFEKSNAQLVSTSNSRVQFQKSSGQLVPIFLFSDECMGFVFQELGPKLLLSWFLPNRPTRSFFNWVFLVVSSARCLVLSWFRGELIKMLYGSALHPLFPLASEFSKELWLCAAVFKIDIYQISSNIFKDQQKFQKLAT